MNLAKKRVAISSELLIFQAGDCLEFTTPPANPTTSLLTPTMLHISKQKTRPIGLLMR